jgi:hypothetical protein
MIGQFHYPTLCLVKFPVNSATDFGDSFISTKFVSTRHLILWRDYNVAVSTSTMESGYVNNLV